ncbi:hypothetical protein AKJ41_04640 [candidate division MSBL1 archaeon SCGC-AAA259O05]|uniref:Uncharacterized protein n=1 Tax=candidate division MSBL1 archaeon SCGC-AAA259O05 TaxID=1698271 RepID=A0A133V0K1_9EURY|nr:hypothetical protein AKJ41_04640 [candidate division MSBL1 archaeon SCGC-AAA259O05]
MKVIYPSKPTNHVIQPALGFIHRYNQNKAKGDFREVNDAEMPNIRPPPSDTAALLISFLN